MSADPKDKEILKLKDELIKTREELDLRYQDLNRIHEIVNVIHSTLDLTELTQITKTIIERTLGLKAFSLIVYDGINKEFIVVETRGLDKRIEQDARDIVAESAELWAERHTKSTKMEIIRITHADGTKMIYIPLIAYKRTVGGLCTTEDVIDNEKSLDDEMLSLVTSQLTVAMENSILFEITKKLSITDDKTGVFNHRYMMSRLDLEWRRAQRYDRPLSFMMIDLDDFKLYNDSFGHVKGDKVLFELAGLLTSVCREIDIVARYGGEEFGVVLPETDTSGAEILARRIGSELIGHLFEGAEKRDQRLSVSVGIASFPVHALTPKHLISVADTALYEAKKTGKRNYKVAGKLPIKEAK